MKWVAVHLSVGVLELVRLVVCVPGFIVGAFQVGCLGEFPNYCAVVNCSLTVVRGLLMVLAFVYDFWLSAYFRWVAFAFVRRTGAVGGFRWWCSFVLVRVCSLSG